MFRAESSDMSDKIIPRTSALSWAILRLYLAISFACWVAYMLANMGAFDALLHAMTTISTGGFSTRNASLAAFDSVAIEAVAIGFMIAGSLPFIVYLQSLNRGIAGLWQDTQARSFLLVLAGFIALMTLLLNVAGEEFATSLRLASFNITAILTGTGYSTANFSLWGNGALAVFFVIALFGGCAGSTTGGIKIFRLQFLWQLLAQRLRLLLNPRAIVAMHYQQRSLPENVAISAVVFIATFLLCCFALALFLELRGLDVLSAWSAAVACLSNVGPALGAVLGPAGTYAPLTADVKWVLAFAMVLGRLELFTILILFAPQFWRR